MAQFASVVDLQSYLGRDIDGTRAELLLRLSSAAIQRGARQRLEQAAGDAVTLHGNWTEQLWLPERPVTAVISVVIRNGSGFGVDLSLAQGTDYTWSKLGLLRRVSYITGRLLQHAQSYWGGDAADVEVTYTHGYATVPDDIRGLCLQVAKRLYVNPDQIAAETIGSYQVTYQGSADGGVQLTDDERRTLRPYRFRAQAQRSYV